MYPIKQDWASWAYMYVKSLACIVNQDSYLKPLLQVIIPKWNASSQKRMENRVLPK